MDTISILCLLLGFFVGKWWNAWLTSITITGLLKKGDNPAKKSFKEKLKEKIEEENL